MEAGRSPTLADDSDGPSPPGKPRLRIDRRILLWDFLRQGLRESIRYAPSGSRACSCGGIGWPIAPTVKIENERLRYPIGLAISMLYWEALRFGYVALVAWFLFRGADDTNDPVDYRDCYAESDAELIRRRFGSTPASRWPAAQRLYAEARLPALWYSIRAWGTPGRRRFGKTLHNSSRSACVKFT